MSKEIRYAPVKELRATTENGIKKIGGYAAVYNSRSLDLGGFLEIVSPSAFQNALQPDSDVLCLRDHDVSLLMGRTKSKTLTLTSDDKGLSFECVLPNTDSANALYESISRGDLDACSFGFNCNDDSWEQIGTQVIRTLLDVDLLEISAVSFPAYVSTSVSTRSAPFEIRSLLESRAKKPLTKEVDGEHLAADCFLIVLDPNKTETWNLPWKFSTDEKTESHLRDALARFDQLKDVPADVKEKAWTKLVELCKQYKIDVSASDKRSLGCMCPCSQCQANACNICSTATCNYFGCTCPDQTNSRANDSLLACLLARK